MLYMNSYQHTVQNNFKTPKENCVSRQLENMFIKFNETFASLTLTNENWSFPHSVVI